MTERYDWSQFKVHMVYRAPRDDVVAAWATPGGLESFFIADGQVHGAVARAGFRSVAFFAQADRYTARSG